MTSNPHGWRLSVSPLSAFLLLCGLTAVCIDLGSIHRQHQADSLVPILTSLYRWTPYYWETNRYGMLVPLLAMPIKHPLFNLLFQDGLTIFSGLAVLGLLPRYVLRNSTCFPAALFSLFIFLALAPERFRFAYLVDQSYGVSFALGLSGLILCQRAGFRRLALALVLMSLAHWVNIGSGLLLVPLILLRAVLFRDETGDSDNPVAKDSLNQPSRQPSLLRVLRTDLDGAAVNAVVVVAAGFGIGLLAMQLSSYHETPEGLRSPDRWGSGWSQLVANTWTALSPSYWPILALVLAQWGLVGQLSVGNLSERRLTAFRAATVFLAAATIYLGFLGTLTWVERGGFADRYTIPAVLLLHTATSVLAIAPLVSWLDWRGWRWAWTFAPLILAIVVSSYGYPSLPSVREDLAKRCGSRTSDLLASRCTHLAGNYWEVWPAVFHANLVHYERGEEAMVWGVAFRSDPTRSLFSNVPRDQMRIAIPHQDQHAPALLRLYRFPLLNLVEKRPTLTIYCPRQNETAQNNSNRR